MSQRLSHAIHNEKVAKFLRTKPEYVDWIVTTSFYSALHFVEHFIFPFEHEEKGKKILFETIGDYHHYKIRQQTYKSKHELRQDLVIWRCPDLEIPFKFLHDTANTARYYNFKILNPQITLGLVDTNLKTIKAYCSNKENPVKTG
jgi:hypothetical protein